MIIDCDVSPKMNSICASRSIPELQLNAGCLLYGFGSLPAIDAVFDNGIQRATQCVAGSVTHSLDQIMQGETCGDLPQVAQHLAQTLKMASRNLWELNQSAGQGIYVAGVIAYFTDLQYIAIPFGGAVLLGLQAQQLVRLDKNQNNPIIHDAVGSRAGWSGKVIQGSLAPRDILWGATESPRDWNGCQEQLLEYSNAEIRTGSASSLLRQHIAVAREDAAVIAFRA